MVHVGVLGSHLTSVFLDILPSALPPPQTSILDTVISLHYMQY